MCSMSEMPSAVETQALWWYVHQTVRHWSDLSNKFIEQQKSLHLIDEKGMEKSCRVQL